jgi:hypothetical protein
MAVTPPYIRLSNGNIITFEKLGPKKRAVLSNSEGIRIREGDYLIGSTEKNLANTIILGFSDPKPTIIEEVLSPPPTSPPPPSPPPPITPTPEKVEQERLQEASEDNSTLSQINLNTLDATQIERATPSDLKAMGIAKLPLLLLVIENKLKQIIIASLEDLIKKQISRYVGTNTCPSPPEIANIRRVRNDIVDQLNTIGRTLNTITISLTAASTFLSLISGTIRTVKNVALGVSVASKFIPSPFPGVPGAVVSGLNDAQTFIRETTFDAQGNSKLSKIASVTGGAALVAAIISINIQLAIVLLNSIDALLNKCAPNDSTLLNPTSKEIKDIADAQSQANETQNLTTYQGFIIEIEEVPFTPTVTRRQAVGKNQSGIKLIQTELSFSTNNQTLIDELKFIIDRDNLKAY